MNYAIVQDRFNSWLKSDSTDFDYKGSDPEPTYMKDIIDNKTKASFKKDDSSYQ